MKKSVNAKTERGAKRDLFAELREGMEALAEARAPESERSELTRSSINRLRPWSRRN